MSRGDSRQLFPVLHDVTPRCIPSQRAVDKRVRCKQGEAIQ